MKTIPELGWANEQGVPTKADDQDVEGPYLGQDARIKGFPLVYVRWDYPKTARFGDQGPAPAWDPVAQDELFHAPSVLLHPKCGRNTTVRLANRFIPEFDNNPSDTAAAVKGNGKSVAGVGAGAGSWEGVASPDSAGGSAGKHQRYPTDMSGGKDLTSDPKSSADEAYDKEEWDWVPLPVLTWVLDPEYMYELVFGPNGKRKPIKHHANTHPFHHTNTHPFARWNPR
jgi:hypothetical protein